MDVTMNNGISYKILEKGTLQTREGILLIFIL